LTDLAGDRLRAVFADLEAPAALALDAAGLRCRWGSRRLEDRVAAGGNIGDDVSTRAVDA
jgi:hypothetical protein